VWVATTAEYVMVEGSTSQTSEIQNVSVLQQDIISQISVTKITHTQYSSNIYVIQLKSQSNSIQETFMGNQPLIVYIKWAY
jgi:hypothetical protein